MVTLGASFTQRTININGSRYRPPLRLISSHKTCGLRLRSIQGKHRFATWVFHRWPEVTSRQRRRDRALGTTRSLLKRLDVCRTSAERTPRGRRRQIDLLCAPCRIGWGRCGGLLVRSGLDRARVPGRLRRGADSVSPGGGSDRVVAPEVLDEEAGLPVTGMSRDGLDREIGLAK